jgi:hypothetical protein
MFDWANPNVDLLGYPINPTFTDSTASGSSTSPSWVDSVTGLLGGAVNAYATVNAINHNQTAPNGLQYVNGQFTTASGSISPLILIAGAGLVLFLFLKD